MDERQKFMLFNIVTLGLVRRFGLNIMRFLSKTSAIRHPFELHFLTPGWISWQIRFFSLFNWGIWRNWKIWFFDWGGTVGGRRYKVLKFRTIRSPKFNPTHHWGPYIILSPLFPCSKSSLNHLNPFTTAQVCLVGVVWVFRVGAVLQMLPEHVSVTESGTLLLLLSTPVHFTLTRTLVESSIWQSKKQYTLRTIIHS